MIENKSTHTRSLIALGAMVITIFIVGVIGYTLGKMISTASTPTRANSAIYIHGNMSYIVFETKAGQVIARNYTLDSLEFATQKRFMELEGR